MKRSLINLAGAILVLSFALFQQSATASKLKDMALTNFASGQKETVIATDNVATIAMVYQPDCLWCKKQSKWLAKVQQQCQHQVNLALIGYKGNARQLKRELKYFDPELSAFKADGLFLRAIGGVDASPTTLFFDDKGQLLAKRRGYIEPQLFAKAVATLTKQSCHL